MQIFLSDTRRKWRADRRCGSGFPLPDGTPGQCDPDGDKPCCDKYGTCRNDVYSCLCTNCVDFRVIRQIKKSGQNCTLVKLHSGFLKHACYDEVRNQVYYQCINSHGHYIVNMNNKLRSVSEVCENDPHFYQACGFATQPTNTNVLCGGYLCDHKDRGKHKYIMCTGDGCKSENRNMRCIPKRGRSGGTLSHQTVPELLTNNTTNDLILFGESKSLESEEILSTSAAPSTDSFTTSPSSPFYYDDGLILNPFAVTAQTPYLSDDSIYCEHMYREVGKQHPVPVYLVCDGHGDCTDGSDEQDCSVTNKKRHTCTHYRRKVLDNKTLIVPILNNTRCSLFDLERDKYLYCLNYLDQTNCSDIERSETVRTLSDQTNCSDIERIGGYCRVNGYVSAVSKYMVCYEYDIKLGQNIQLELCDDGIQNKCISPSTSNSKCRVHKHLMCNGVKDCLDGTGVDETHQICRSTTEEINFTCKRRFHPKSDKGHIPISWLMDDVEDCMNGEDENSTLWVVCPENVISPARFPCQDAFICPGVENTSVLFRQLCNGIDSCGNGRENAVCRIARDFPALETSAIFSGHPIRNY